MVGLFNNVTRLIVELVVGPGAGCCSNHDKLHACSYAGVIALINHIAWRGSWYPLLSQIGLKTCLTSDGAGLEQHFVSLQERLYH